ncbi:MAG TPA: zf-HC2 domain-containing protein, partial [Candidatus Acidoferrales bacterium]|nr:zf-HC2 domain-containing protein [Candidatus Acidoferrales bacterium]
MNDVQPHDQMLELVAVYVLGALSQHDALAVSEHIALCPECRTEYDALRPVADSLGYAAEERVDDVRTARMRSKLMQRVDPVAAVRSQLEAKPRRRAPLWPAYLAAAAAIVIALINIVIAADLR